MVSINCKDRLLCWGVAAELLYAYKEKIEIIGEDLDDDSQGLCQSGTVKKRRQFFAKNHDLISTEKLARHPVPGMIPLPDSEPCVQSNSCWLLLTSERLATLVLKTFPPRGYQLPTNSSSARSGISGLPLPSMPGFGRPGTCTALVHTVSITVSSRVQLPGCVQKTPFPRLGPYTFSALCSTMSPEPWEEGSDTD